VAGAAGVEVHEVVLDLVDAVERADAPIRAPKRLSSRAQEKAR
jgi:hypothetical protein